MAGWFHLLVLYTVWSSTYLAIRVAVAEPGGFPPFTMAGMRTTAAAALVFLIAAARRQSFRVSWSDIGILATSGLFLWIGGNGLVTWAEQDAESGFAALVVGSMPIWTAVFESVLDRRLPSRHLVLSLIIGLIGVGLLTSPALAAPNPAPALALLAAPMLWAVGALIQQRKRPDVPPLVSSGYQMLFASLGFVLLVVLLEEPAARPTQEAWFAWGYLVIFGSVLAFTSFVQALRLLPTNVVMTYAYVNPVLAAFLGWWLLGESITLWTVAGGALVLAGVAGVFNERYRS